MDIDEPFDDTFLVPAPEPPTQTKGSSKPVVPPDFHGCYCLVSQSEERHYKGRTYIGYTVNAVRRIRQHNGGKQKGGAKKTSDRGPWHMVVIIHGFMTSKDALRFEWAWQNPTKSRRLAHVSLSKRSKETPFAHRFRVAMNMLASPPWHRQPIVVQWLRPEYRIPHPLNTPALPIHMTFDEGALSPQPAPITVKVDVKCATCRLNTTRTNICHCPACGTTFHLSCLREAGFSETSLLRPLTAGKCPDCQRAIEWHRVVRQRRLTVKNITNIHLLESNEFLT